MICGPLSDPDKMPGHGYAVPASNCRLGSLLRHVRGTVCSYCYARRGRYVYPAVKNAMQRRLASIFQPRWIEAISTLIRCSGDKYFRWHDSGDLQGLVHFLNVIRACRNLPNVRFWLPTREYQTVEAYRKTGGVIPPNLCIRYSAHFVDGPPPLRYGLPTSTVSSATRSVASDAHRCPALRQGSRCGTCRACWDTTVRIVEYPLKWAVRQAEKKELQTCSSFFMFIGDHSSAVERARYSAWTFWYCCRRARIWIAKSSNCRSSRYRSAPISRACIRCSCNNRFRKK